MHNSGQQNIKKIMVPSIKPNWFPKIYSELMYTTENWLGIMLLRYNALQFPQ